MNTGSRDDVRTFISGKLLSNLGDMLSYNVLIISSGVRPYSIIFCQSIVSSSLNMFNLRCSLVSLKSESVLYAFMESFVYAIIAL